MMNILLEENRKARKEHICDYCHKPIMPGEHYDYARMIESGEIWEWKSHEKCQFLVDEIYSDYGDIEAEYISDEKFNEMCYQYCQDNICEKCQYNESDECESQKPCIDKIFQHIKSKE